ncbi:MAG TPA: nucleoside recognition domain-containing protein, partial [Bacillota bacterium]|nr:nucleoside recognition domain-containing protein [Bacillota bacterium]
MKKSNLYNGLWALFSVVMVVLLVRYPEQALQAAIEGAAVWWEAVFPALLPFFIVSEIALGTGVVNLLGALLEPLMRPVFNVPGEGAYSVAMGIASGYPLGAKITRGLYEAGDLTKGEAERLVSFSSTANPVFIVGAVAVGMFKSPHAGAAMALVHYTSALLLGFFLSFLEKRPKDKGRPRRKATLHEAWERMINARRKDGRSFGEILGDAVWQSVNSALKIGG